MTKGDTCETLQEVIGNGNPDDRFNNGVNTVIELMGNWFNGRELDEFLTFVKSEDV